MAHASEPGEAVRSPSLRVYAETLLCVAEAAIDHGLIHGSPPEIELARHPTALHEPRAVFASLADAAGELRGCVGCLDSDRPLVAEVSASAYSAAFRDPRFPPLTHAERRGLVIKLSVLTPLEPVAFDTEDELLATLEPGVDGLLLEVGDLRGTFLPAVWEQLPEPAEFWRTLKLKAGLTADAFPAGLSVYRYRTETLG